MFSLKIDSQKKFSHLSFLPPDAIKRIQEICSKEKSYKNTGYFLGFYLSMELMNRVSTLKTKKLYVKGLGVLFSIVLGGKIAKTMYWRNNKKLIDDEIRKYPFPIYDKPSRVPDLNRSFFVLDDDLNYLPSPLYHGK